MGTESLARRSANRPWRTVAIWVVLLVTAGVMSSQFLGDALTTEITFTNEPESAEALEVIEDLRDEEASTEFVVVQSDGAVATESEFVDYVTEIQTTLGGSAAVATVGSYLTEDGPVSESGTTALLPVVLNGANGDEASANAALVRAEVEAIATPEGFEALVAGPTTLDNDFDHIAEEDLATGEMIGIGVALLVLVFVFGSVAS